MNTERKYMPTKAAQAIGPLGIVHRDDDYSKQPKTVADETGLSVEELGPFATAPSTNIIVNAEEQRAVWGDYQGQPIDNEFQPTNLSKYGPSALEGAHDWKRPSAFSLKISSSELRHDRKSINQSMEIIYNEKLPHIKSRLWEKNIQPILDKYVGEARWPIGISWWCRVLDDDGLWPYLRSRYNIQEKLFKSFHATPDGYCAMDESNFKLRYFVPDESNGARELTLGEYQEWKAAKHEQEVDDELHTFITNSHRPEAVVTIEHHPEQESWLRQFGRACVVQIKSIIKGIK